MKGLNKMTFNAATMQEIVQHYLDTVLMPEEKGSRVSRFYVTPNNLSSSSDSFSIDLLEKLEVDKDE